jgi:hypothetical protein
MGKFRDDLYDYYDGFGPQDEETLFHTMATEGVKPKDPEACEYFYPPDHAPGLLGRYTNFLQANRREFGSLLDDKEESP